MNYRFLKYLGLMIVGILVFFNCSWQKKVYFFDFEQASLPEYRNVSTISKVDSLKLDSKACIFEKSAEFSFGFGKNSPDILQNGISRFKAKVKILHIPNVNLSDMGMVLQIDSADKLKFWSYKNLRNVNLNTTKWTEFEMNEILPFKTDSTHTIKVYFWKSKYPTEDILIFDDMEIEFGS